MSVWNGDDLDLDRYLAYLGHDGGTAATLDTLRALQRAHVLTVKWENLDAYLHKEVAIDLPSVQAKLLSGIRGGYCYEHVTLFAAALARLGFQFHAIQGRVQMGSTTIRPATHAMLIVTIDHERWLTDVGFGASPMVPLRLTGGETSDGAWTYRLRSGEITPGLTGWALEQRVADGSWFRRHTFTPQPQYPIDFRVGNYFVASSTQSPFSTRIYVQRVQPDRLHILDHLTLSTHLPDGTVTESRLLEPGAVPGVLATTFGIELKHGDERLLLQRLSETQRA